MNDINDLTEWLVLAMLMSSIELGATWVLDDLRPAKASKLFTKKPNIDENSYKSVH